MEMKTANPPKESAKSKWFRAGNHILATRGPDALTIELLCQHTGLTKGSFYHHFSDRDAYIDALLSAWEEKSTLQIIAWVNESAEPQQKLRMLTRLSLTEVDVALERRIRAWAQLDERVYAYQQRVDGRRQEYLVDIWTEVLGNAARARESARLVYAIFTGGQTMLPAATPEEYLRWFTQLEPASSRIK